MATSILIGYFLLIAVASCGLTYGLRKWALSRKALVQPSERCSHTVPTPHGGGIAIGVLALALTVPFAISNWVPDLSMGAMLALGLVMLAVGVWDDFGDLPAKLRLGVHLVVVVLGMLAIPTLPVFSVLGFEVDSSSAFLLWPILVLGWAWLINLYNFMDGIDGLAAVQAIVVLGGMALNFAIWGPHTWTWICLLTLASVLGFVIWNWPPARIFMGDGGSGFLGFALGFLMLLSASTTTVSMWSWIILLTLFIADATTTLFVRLLTGQNVLQAHRLHAYQKLAQRAGSHLPVTSGYGLVMLIVLLPASMVANAVPGSGVWVFALLFAVFSSIAFKLGAGRQEL
ncbi:MraY family glycosyltransferase [Marinobacter pelagius]|uniref:MraY family glycosyltransferase n=1 Tax=Marinobacter pelagius TaxID=379482 RepID=UPI0011140C15|nr:glycosyltransferase family 4 protein [Marinobacter pelagius]